MRKPVCLLLVSALSFFIVPAGVSAEEEGAAPGPKPGVAPGRGRGGGGRMLERLKEMDVNGDGQITAEEFRGPDRMFDRLDRNGDGTISKGEIEARMQGGRRPTEGSSRRGSRGLTPDAVDTDGDKKVSKAELAAWHAKADKNGDGFVDAAEWEAALSGRALRDPAPAVGSAAPAVKAKKLGSKEMRDLGKVQRTTVLIFGSHT